MELRTVIICATLLILGLSLGIGSYTFIYAQGFSYLSDNPDACRNCHVMNQVYDDWLKGGHQHVAGCNDCHVPKDFFGKWYTKANNGFHHSWAFTFLDVPVRIRAREASRRVVEANCLRCHGDVAHNAFHAPQGKFEPLDCLSCHREIGHAH